MTLVTLALGTLLCALGGQFLATLIGQHTFVDLLVLPDKACEGV
jgi:hypothetical protein